MANNISSYIFKCLVIIIASMGLSCAKTPIQYDWGLPPTNRNLVSFKAPLRYDIPIDSFNKYWKPFWDSIKRKD